MNVAMNLIAAGDPSIGSALAPIWKVLLVGLVLGAGLPAVFAVGVHFGASHTNPDGTTAAARPAGKAIAGVCFLIVALAIAFGLAVLVDAKHVLPAFGLNP